jgi:hypothetical protein
VDKIWGAKPVCLQVYQILSDGEFEDPKMIGNRGAAIIAIARRGGDRMMGDVYSWQILPRRFWCEQTSAGRRFRELLA